MKKIIILSLIPMFITAFLITGCQNKASAEKSETVSPSSVQVDNLQLETVEIAEGDTVMYLPVVGAEASSFDQTPDWAPEPNPMAPSDGDMLTRWSSNYTEGDQWIYFDLGTRAVVNEVITRWERAYAAAYKILVSNDANSWQEVFYQNASQGGVTDDSFNPIKCRYVKILGTERVNEDWGISIWEVEIYGPKSGNPQAVMSKENYLNKAEDEDKKKEALDLISSLASPPVSMGEEPFQKGVVYTSWVADELAMPASDFTLAYLKETGYDTIAIMVPAYQEDLDSKEVFTNDGPDGDTPTIEALAHAVEVCHKIGLRVMIKPHVDPRTNEARINIMPSAEWFDSYEKFVVKYAEFSQENNVEIFCIGTELEATTFSAWDGRWREIIQKTKQVYTGIVTYAANWTEYKEVPFWDLMDYIGIDAYFPLAETDDPTPQELVAAWEARANEIDEWLKQKGLTEKGVILTEIGYPSSNGAGRQPWVAISNVEDQAEQAACMEATFSVLTKRSWFKGYYIWQYFPQDRWSPLGFTVKGKQAEEVIKKMVKNMITIKGGREMKKLLLIGAALCVLFTCVITHAEEETVLFDFENGLQGWEIPDWAYEKPDHVQQEIEPSTDYASEGASSMKMDAIFTGGRWTGAIVEIMQYYDWSDYGKLACDIYLPKDAPLGLKGTIILTVGDTWKWVEMSKGFNLVPGKWVTISADLLPGSIDWRRVQVDEAFRTDIRKIDIRVESNNKPAYTGPIYIDNIRVIK